MAWKLKPGVKWHDGKPLTADDLVFTWEYARDPATAAVTTGSYKDLQGREGRRPQRQGPVRQADARTGADAFVGIVGMVLPKHLFGPYIGAKSRDAPPEPRRPWAPARTGSSSSGPATSSAGERNPDYHLPNRPYFDTIEMKGGGDAVSAARAVLQTGEYDYAWNMQVEDEVLKRLETGGKGRVDVVYGGKLEFLLLNATDPNVEVDGERASIKTKHPAFSDPKVRQAMNLLVDRKSIQTYIYGRTGQAHRQHGERPGALRLQEHEVRLRPRPRPTRSWTRPAGGRARTASAPRTARGSSCCSRPRSTPRARRPRRSSSRPPRRPASRSS